eukprot:scaffold11813_cov61-Attheya_sp.AAC.3
MDYMFRGAKSFNQDLSSWESYKVTKMDGMFWGAPLSVSNHHNIVSSSWYSKYQCSNNEPAKMFGNNPGILYALYDRAMRIDIGVCIYLLILVCTYL